MKRICNRIGWVFIVIGAIAMVMGLIDLSRSLKTPVDFNTLSADKIEKGMIIEGDLHMNLGAYVENYTTTNGVKTGSSKYAYIISVGGEETEHYMGLLESSSSDREEFESQCDESYAYFNGLRESMPRTIHFKGRVVSMGKEEQEYMQEALSYIFSDYDADSIPYIPYVIEIENYDNWYVSVILGVVFLGIGLIFLLIQFLLAKKTTTVIEPIYTAGDMMENSPLSEATTITEENIDSSSSFQMKEE